MILGNIFIIYILRLEVVITFKRIWVIISIAFTFISSEISWTQEFLKRFDKAKAEYAKDRFVTSSLEFYWLARSIERSPKHQARDYQTLRYKSIYYLGSSLLELDLFYAAASYFVDVIRNSKNRNLLKAAVAGLNDVNKQATLGTDFIAAVFYKKINANKVASKDRGFYHYHIGLYYFANAIYDKAYSYLRRVVPESYYHLNASYYLGILNLLAKRYAKAEYHFKYIIDRTSGFKASKLTKRYRALREMTILNIARLYYEIDRFEKSIEYYSRIRKDSDNWLTALFEASWAFFRIGKHSNTLGNIHTIQSPYFKDRFFPEAYILQSITYLYLCYYYDAKYALLRFKRRYQPLFGDIKQILREYKNRPASFFELVRDYAQGRRVEFIEARSIINALSITNQFKESRDLVKNIKREERLLEDMPTRFRESSLVVRIDNRLNKLSKRSRKEAGIALFTQIRHYYSYLNDLSDQGKVITLQLLEGKLAKISKRMILEPMEKTEKLWGEGMKPLNLKSVHEYWPFKGEYWEDELGGYVYNIESLCNKPKRIN